MDERRPYFAYGSNLNAADLKAWSSSNGANFSSMEPICTAWLLDHSMAFHYFSRNRGGGAADVVQNGRGTVVPGVLFSLSEDGWSWMDKKEEHCVGLTNIIAGLTRKIRGAHKKIWGAYKTKSGVEKFADK